MNTITTPAPDYDRRIDLVGGMASLLGVKASRERLAGYAVALEDIPCDVLAQSIRRTIQVWRFPDMPKPADLRAVAEELIAVARDTAEKRARETERRQAREPFEVFGRMSKTAVKLRFGSFVADAKCDCMACWDADVMGPPRFVPDGTDPPPVCDRCQDTGQIEVRESDSTALLSVSRCIYASSNPQLNPATRYHPTEMGRWIHGHELREHELAQLAFEQALRGVVERARMPKERQTR